RRLRPRDCHGMIAACIARQEGAREAPGKSPQKAKAAAEMDRSRKTVPQTGRESMTNLLRLTGAAAVLCGILPGAAAADAVADYYGGRTITVVVGSGAGGAYGLSARLFGDYASKYIPGNPNVIYQYMPGSGGVKVMNYIYNAAAKDGTVLGMPQQGTPLGKLLRDDPNQKFENSRLNWIGTVARSHYLIGVWHTAPATTIEGARKAEVLLGSSGASSTTTMYPLLVNY